MVSEKEMRELMGYPYIPGTFPTVGVTDRMKSMGVNTSWSQVDQLWDAYYLALTAEGLRPYSKTLDAKGKADLLNSMAARTSVSKNTVAAWLNALVDETAENGRPYFLDPVTANAADSQVVKSTGAVVGDVAAQVGQAAGNILKPSADALTNVLKYGAMALVAGAAIYAIYEFTPVFKGRKKSRRKG